jgi:uncharacterized membrane protein
MSDQTPTGPSPASDRTVMCILSYLWLLALVPLLADTRDAEVQWHARHGIVLMVVEFVAMVGWMILMSILWIMTGGLLGCLFTIFSPVLILAIIAVHAVAIVKAIGGRRLVIPGISEYASRF